MAKSRLGVVFAVGLFVVAVTAPLAAQTRVLEPPRTHRGARIVRGFYIPPPDGPVESQVAGRALLLRDPGGLLPELIEACSAARTLPDSGRALLRRRVDSLEVARTWTTLRGGWHFGPLEPGRYLAISWIELRWPAAARPRASRTQAFFGVDTISVEVSTDTGLVMFNTGRPGFRTFDARSAALRCLEFLVTPSPP